MGGAWGRYVRVLQGLTQEVEQGYVYAMDRSNVETLFMYATAIRV